MVSGGYFVVMGACTADRFALAGTLALPLLRARKSRPGECFTSQSQSQNMKAVVISRPGAAEVLTVVERPVPAIGETGVLIRVQAAGLDRADVMQRHGLYPSA